LSAVNIIPTMEGGLRVDIEDTADWLLLRHLIEDASGRDESLARQLGGLMEHEPEIAEDWREFVVPELEEQFAGSLQIVGKAIADAVRQCHGGPGSLWVTREDGFHWYSSFNQARLAIEERYEFGDSARDDLQLLDNSSRQLAWYRSQFYLAVQGLLLEHVLS